MTDDEARPVISGLRQLLEKRDLSWIVRGVDEALRLGKPTLRKITTEPVRKFVGVDEELSMPEESQERVGRRKWIQISSVKKYTDLEELKMLVDALERTVVAVSEMRPQIAASIRKVDKDSQPITEIRFERDGELGAPLFMDEHVSEECTTLRNALNALRTQL